MSNAFNAGALTWVCDTTGALTTERVKVKTVRWDGGTSASAGDRAILKSANGSAFFSSTADGADFQDEELVETWINGITVDTLGHGTLYITLE